MHFRSEQYTDALGAINRALAAGEYWRYLDLRGRIDYREHRCILALKSYDRALARRPQVAAVYNMRGQVRRCVDNYEGALEEWDRALALDAMEPSYLLAKGEALKLLGRDDDAREMLDKAIFYGAYDPAVRASRGALLVNYFDQAEAALEDLYYATKMVPDHAPYWRDYGDALFRSNHCDAAAALATYLRLCEDGAECPIEDLDWAAGAIEDISHADCQG
jgi:tetratricopeptide (TPR) repeat protein